MRHAEGFHALNPSLLLAAISSGSPVLGLGLVLAARRFPCDQHLVAASAAWLMMAEAFSIAAFVAALLELAIAATASINSFLFMPAVGMNDGSRSRKLTWNFNGQSEASPADEFFDN
jgi:hypothetical protein